MGWVEDGETPDDAHGQLTDLEDLVVEGHKEGGQVLSLGQVIVEAVVQALHHAPSASHGLTSLTQILFCWHFSLSRISVEKCVKLNLGCKGNWNLTKLVFTLILLII